ncbi:MAG: sigma-54 dependent transcriptional regulator [Proteobacteria bacterium]|nr:sigma-54 dependent transcriptional regulator [Pseudomonadota bacterium]
MKNKILLIDDDESLVSVTEYNLISAGFQVICASSGTEGLKLFFEQGPDLVITDVRLGDLSGLDVLNKIKESSPETPVIVFTAFGSIDMAVEAMRRGAFHFITKPFDRDTLRLSCTKALEYQNLKSRNSELEDEIHRLTGVQGMETASSAMRELLETALKVAQTEATVLISGESGTGKELLARMIHRNSPRKNGPLVSVNCAAIPEGLIESELFGHVKGAFTGAVKARKGKFQAASEGTLFLDEIGELKIEMQAKLLRAIQEMEVAPVGSDTTIKTRIRLITATNKNLEDAVKNGTFREDLFYRISVIPLNIPPLRKRKEDIPLLTGHFLKRFMAPSGTTFSPEAMDKMKAHGWPGNIRELQNTVERALILAKGKILGPQDVSLTTGFPETIHTGIPDIPDEGISLEEVERGLIEKALEKSGGNRSQAARLLKIHRHVLIYRLEKYNM